jgi:hypothetical protein
MQRQAGLVLVSSVLLLLAPAAARATVTVANTNDSGPGSLREAVATAPGGELIIVPAGTYTLTSESLQINKSLTVVGHATGDTTIRAGGNFGVISAAGPAEVNLSDLTVRDGNIVGSGAGAGIFAVNADLALQRVSVVHNTVDADGAPGSGGGPVSGAGLYFVGPSLEIVDSTVSDNTASAAGGSGKFGGAISGGGIFAVVNAGRVRIASSTIAGNVADARGGQGPASPEQAGGAISGGGYFIVANSPSSSRVDDSTFANNSADASGGPGGPNGAISGGGIFEVTNSAPMTYTNVTITGNVAKFNGASGGAGGGGGIYSVGNQPVSFFNTTIASNRIDGSLASGGGGNADLFNKVFFKDSIVANGSGPSGSENCMLAGGPSSLGFNLDSSDQCGFHGVGDRVNADPQLGPLADNGGPTQTMLPAATSPVVDQGVAVRPEDQREVVRPIDFPSIANAAGGDGSDIGAVELQPASSLKLGKLAKNKKKGTAKVTVSLPTPSAGTLTLTGKGLKKQTKAITGQASIKLTIATKGGAAKSLRKKGKRKVTYEVAYAPTGNAAATRSKSVTLVLKSGKKQRKKKRRG